MAFVGVEMIKVAVGSVVILQEEAHIVKIYAFECFQD